MGSNPRAGPLDSVVFPTQSPSYQPNWLRYRYRPAKARQLLEQARCRPGPDGIYVCAGAKLSLRVVTTAGNERRQLTLELVQQQLRRIEVEAMLSYRRIPRFSSSSPRQASSTSISSAGHCRPAPQAGLFAIFSCGAPLNYTGYCSRLVTDDLNESSRILDPGRQVLLLNKVDRQLALAVPVIPLFQGHVPSSGVRA
jgi:peptide/nickel transport system substrate-binding protein